MINKSKIRPSRIQSKRNFIDNFDRFHWRSMVIIGTRYSFILLSFAPSAMDVGLNRAWRMGGGRLSLLVFHLFSIAIAKKDNGENLTIVLHWSLDENNVRWNHSFASFSVFSYTTINPFSLTYSIHHRQFIFCRSRVIYWRYVANASSIWT